MQGIGSTPTEALPSLSVPPELAAMSWIARLASEKPSLFYHNVDCVISLRETDGLLVPYSLSRHSSLNSFVASPVSQYLRYPLDELDLIGHSALAALAKALLKPSIPLFQWLGMDRCLQWNNWLLTTNPWPQALSIVSVVDEIRRLVDLHPEYALLIRCVPEVMKDALQEEAKDLLEFFKVRKIFYFDGRAAEFLKKDVVKRDLKLLARDDYEIVRGADFKAQDADRCAELYGKLYLEKHSRLNPSYTSEFVRLCMREGPLELVALRSKESGQLDAVVGWLYAEEELSTPFMGYDTSLPVEWGLYRRLFALTLKEASQRGCLLNFSSGASEFKRRRGGQERWEYSAFAIRHLPRYRQWPFLAVKAVSDTLGTSVMKRA